MAERRLVVPESLGRMPHLWAYLLLYACGLLGGLWQHGHAQLTFVLLAVLAPLGALGYLPLWWFPQWLRTTLQSVIGVVGLGWIYYRFRHGTAPDLALVEGVSILGLAFAFSLRPREFRFSFIISLVLMGYGALLPVRTIYFFVVPLALVLALYLLYRSQLVGLAGSTAPDVLYWRGARGWRVIVVHALVLAGLWSAMLWLFPAAHYETPGLITVSFRTHHRPPPQFNDWLHQEPTELGPDGTPRPGKHPTEAGKTGDPVPSSGQSDSGIELPGGGGSGPSKAPVMRVRCPLKLYWLAALYDVYDGRKWTTSPELVSQRLDVTVARDLPGAHFLQEFVIDRWVSSALYSAYLPTALPNSDSIVKFAPTGFYAARLGANQALPTTPFTYSVQSVVPLARAAPGKAPPAAVWYERLPREHYLQLPAAAITPETRRLAADLVKGQPTPLDRALAIRAHLRKLEYTLDVPKLPASRESVDFLLFTTRKGHCEYYAAAMTVLARLAGLPARVATGFAPGDYNTITGYFEVRQYHAHAWAQVWLDGVGWVTMDATPPSATALQLRALPALIGTLRDPFSDEWQIRAPELAADVAQLWDAEVAAREVEQQHRAQYDPAAGAARETFYRSLYNLFNPRQAAKDPAGWRHPVLGAFAANLGLLTTFAKAKIEGLLHRITVMHVAYALAGSLALLWGTLMYHPLRARMEFYRRLRRCDQYLRFAAATVGDNPDACISYSYIALRDLLALGGLRKRNNMDLFEFGKRLQRVDAALGSDALGVFVVYSQLRYSPQAPTLRDAEAAYARTQQARLKLLQIIFGKTKLAKSA